MNPVPLLSILLAAGPDASLDPAAEALRQEPAPAVTYPVWKGSLAAGAVLTDGNSETGSANLNANAERRGEKDRWTFDAYWNWAEQKTDSISNPAVDEDDTEITVQNYGGGAKYDYFASEKTYYYGNGALKFDPIANLNVRYILGAGVGYQVRENEKLKWGTETGFSYVEENFRGDDNDTSFPALRLASVLAWQISKSTSFDQTAEAFPSLQGAEEFVARIDNRLKANLTAKWIAQLQYVLDFSDDTPPGTEETDHRVVLGLGWSFGS
jgi:putative salt-induced outer membrane protein YdiY